MPVTPPGCTSSKNNEAQNTAILCSLESQSNQSVFTPPMVVTESNVHQVFDTGINNPSCQNADGRHEIQNSLSWRKNKQWQAESSL